MTSVTDPPEPELNQPPRHPQRGLLIMLMISALLLGLVAGWLLLRVSQGRPLFGPPQFNGLVMESPDPVADFTLTSHTGQPMSLSDFRGKPVLLYFGYTFCPDVCPATMFELKKMMAELGAQAEDVQVIMISVDPERDTPAQLGEYVTQFHPSFLGMTGTEEELLAATTQLGIYYQKHEGTAATGYLIDHTATVSMLDENGRLRLVFPFGITGTAMAADVGHFLK